MVKIGLCGVMASGKTTLANKVVENHQGFGKFSLADAVKRFANFVYDIPEGYKDRVAYQKIGDGARQQLYEDIWLDTVLNEIKIHEGINNLENGNEGFITHYIIDDIRYQNEVIKLKSKGWKIIKIEIEDELQNERLKETYPDNWETHIASKNHASESEVNIIPYELFDYIIKASNDDEPYAQVEGHIQQIFDEQKDNHHVVKDLCF